MSTSTRHVPILAKEITEALLVPFKQNTAQNQAGFFLDCTFGGGGHTGLMLEAFAQDPSLRHHRVVGMDQDQGAIEAGRLRFEKEIADGRLTLIQGRFSEALKKIPADAPLLGILADLGFSSDQLDDPGRGLSFRAEGPLDMRLDPSRGMSCYEYLLQVSESELERVLREYGEERFSKRIAQNIVNAKRQKVLPETTSGLSHLIIKSIPSGARHGRIHAATRSFQALRIIVNQELEELDALLEHVILSLRPGGRAAIMSFHSLEDRRVKTAFQKASRGDSPWLSVLTKKPWVASDDEVEKNSRSRSAKLRIAERIS